MAKTSYERGMYWLTVVIAVLTVVMTAAAIAGWYYARAAELRAEGAEKAARVAERERRAAEEKLAQEVQEQKDNLALFESGREAQLSRVLVSLSRYKEVPNEQNLAELRASTKSLVDFVRKWREVIDVINRLLDGQVKRMEESVDKDVKALEEAIRAYEQSSRTDGPLLRKALDRLLREREAKRPKPPPRFDPGTG